MPDTTAITLDELIEQVATAHHALARVLTTMSTAPVTPPLNINPNRSQLQRALHLLASEHESLLGAGQIIARDLPLGPLPESDPAPMLPPDVTLPAAPSTRQLAYMARLASAGPTIGTYRDLIERAGLEVPAQDSPAWPDLRQTLPVSDDALYAYEIALRRAENPIDCGAGAWLAAIAAHECPRCTAAPGEQCRTNTGKLVELQDSHAGRMKPAQRDLGWAAD